MFVCPECGLSIDQAGHCPADGTLLAPRGDDPLLGQTLGAYKIARLLGVGGMGRVYKGVHPQIGSRVAIKVLSFECAQRQDLVERFFAEARAVNLIRHESIVNVLDLSMLPDGRPFIIMEYLDGAALASIIERGGPMPLGSLARLIAEVLDALGAAHAKSVVHRDLKPDNIFVTPAGRPKVLDFGIAKLQQNVGHSATQTGSLLGTPHYMSPEQAMGKPVDHRTDIYAIGVILFECATGRRPFHAESLFDLLRKHVDEPPPPPRALRPDMPPAYEQIILRALDKNPDQRWMSTNALAQALQHACHGLPQEAWVAITPGSAAGMAAQRTPGSWPSGQQSWPGMGSAPPTQPSPTPPHMQPPPQQAPTGLSGQMMPGAAPTVPTRGGGKGVWIALAAVVILGGGGAAAYFATRGGDGEKQEAAGGGDHGEIHGSAVTRDPDVVIPDEPEPDEPEPDVVLPEADDEPPEPEEPSVDLDLKELEAAAKELEEMGAGMAQLRSGTGTGTGSAVPTGPVPLARPKGWDPAAFDVLGYLPTALAEVKKFWPDAQLVRFDVGGVRPTGLAELTLSDDFNARYWFKSEAASKRPADLPAGMKFETTCNVQIVVDASSLLLIPMEGWDCDEIAVKPPKCDMKQAWDKAIAIGAPSGNAVAEVSFMANIVSKQIRWFFTIGEFSEQIPDGC